MQNSHIRDVSPKKYNLRQPTFRVAVSLDADSTRFSNRSQYKIFFNKVARGGEVLSAVKSDICSSLSLLVDHEVLRVFNADQGFRVIFSPSGDSISFVTAFYTSRRLTRIVREMIKKSWAQYGTVSINVYQEDFIVKEGLYVS